MAKNARFVSETRGSSGVGLVKTARLSQPTQFDSGRSSIRNFFQNLNFHKHFGNAFHHFSAIVVVSCLFFIAVEPFPGLLATQTVQLFGPLLSQCQFCEYLHALKC
jgi:hypothetical protein